MTFLELREQRQLRQQLILAWRVCDGLTLRQVGLLLERTGGAVAVAEYRGRRLLEPLARDPVVRYYLEALANGEV